MNTRENLKSEIIAFLENDEEKIMLITGTHQYEKHMEVLRTLNKTVQDGVNVDVYKTLIKNRRCT